MVAVPALASVCSLPETQRLMLDSVVVDRYIPIPSFVL